MAEISYLPELTISNTLDDLVKQIRKFPKEAEKAIVGALNVAAYSGRDKARDLVGRRYTLNRAKIEKDIKVKRGYQKYLYARVYVRTTRSYSVTDYAYGIVASGVRTRIRRDKAPEIIKGAFVNTGKNSGKKLVFRRIGPLRYPIESMQTVTGYEMLNWSDNIDLISQEISTVMIIRLQKALAKLLKAKGKS